MTVESNYAVAIATLSDWLKRLAPVFQPIRNKTKSSRTLYAIFFPRFEQVTGNWLRILIDSSRCLRLCDWSDNLLWFVLVSDSHLKTAPSINLQRSKPKQ